jgi:hypothetical protein
MLPVYNKSYKKELPCGAAILTGEKRNARLHGKTTC